MTDRMPLFLVRPDAGLVRMAPSAPINEDDLQTLIEKYPELIGDSDGDLLLIEREHGIPDVIDGSARWALDHLFVTRNATPVLVEVKRAVDTRLRREVVGQLLDYAANGVAYWQAGGLAAKFEASCEKHKKNPTEILEKFLPEHLDADAFWAQVDANFRAGRIKLVFVADEIPRELARIVEFLNDQMDADVRAVELRYFEGEGGVKTLVPRIIGETERSRAQKAGSRPKLEPISPEDWFVKHIEARGSRVVQGARAFLDVIAATGAETGVASTQGSVYSRLPTALGRPTYPLFLQKNGTGQIGLGYVATLPAFQSDESRQAIYKRFADAVGPLSSSNIRGYPSFPLERLTEPSRLSAFHQVALDFCAACRDTVPSVD